MEFSDFDVYQSSAVKTAIYPEQARIIYPALGLANEAGEALGKIKKVIRDHEGAYSPETRAAISAELGDVLWYIAALCNDLGLQMSNVAEENIKKLYDRAERGNIAGDGDNR
jgi:NTP pyrophosphatase (non-canonical NTP hydrolase)